MSLKVKLVSMVSAFVLVLSLMLVGVLAATNVSLNVGGNVTFTATSVNAKVTGSIVGTKSNPTEELELTEIPINAETADGAVSMPSDWTNMDLTFGENAEPITVTISIQNLSSDRAIQVSLTDNTNIGNVKVLRDYNDVEFETNTSSETISGGQTSTYTFTLSVTSPNNDANGQFDLDISLENAGVSGYNLTIACNSSGAEYMPPEYQNVVFDDDLTISLNGNKKILYAWNSGTLNYSHIETVSFSWDNGVPSDIGDIIVFRTDDYSDYEVFQFVGNSTEEITLSSDTIIIYGIEMQPMDV